MAETVNAAVSGGLPSTSGISDQAAAKLLGRVKDMLEVRSGVGGANLDQWVSFRDLLNNGMLTLPNGQSSVRYPGHSGITWLPQGTGAEFAAPPAVTHFTVTPTLANFILEWDTPEYANHAYTEIWRSGTNDLGTAVKVGATHASLYADAIGQTGAARYYWVRNVSTANVVGPFNATAGTGGTSGTVGNADLSDLIITANKIAAGAIDAYSKFGSGLRPPEIVSTLPATFTNYPVGALVVLTTDQKLYRSTGAAWTKATDGADITANTITAAQIVAGTITATQMAAGTITAGSGVIANGAITNALIGNLAVDSAKIADGSIVTAKIADANITTAKIGSAQITNALMASAAIGTANIVDANITTLKVAGNAVTFPYILAGSATNLSGAQTTCLTTGSHTFGDGSGSTFPVIVLVSVELRNTTTGHQDDVTVQLTVDGTPAATFYAFVDTTWSSAPRTWTAVYKVDLTGSHYFTVTAARSGSGGTLSATATLSYLHALR